VGMSDHMLYEPLGEPHCDMDIVFENRLQHGSRLV
jgi:hypothetical protein